MIGCVLSEQSKNTIEKLVWRDYAKSRVDDVRGKSFKFCLAIDNPHKGYYDVNDELPIRFDEFGNMYPEPIKVRYLDYDWDELFSLDEIERMTND
jgi:hypothetical protein